MKPYQLPRLRPGSWISLDTETSGLFPDDGARVSVVSVAWFMADEIDPPRSRSSRHLPNASDGVCGAAFPFAHGAEVQPWFNGTLPLFDSADGLNLPAEEWDALREWVVAGGLRVVEHNAQYDLIMMGPGAGTPEWCPAGAQSWNMDDAVKWDTFLGCKNLWPTLGKSLEAAAQDHKLGKKLGDPVKDWIRKNKSKYVKMGYPSWASGYDLVPWLLMGEYATEDAVLTLKLQRLQEAMFKDGYGDYAEFMGKQMPLMKLFVKMERRGIPYPQKVSLEQVGKLEKKRAQEGKALPFQPTAEAAKSYFFTEKTTTRGFEGLGLEPLKVSEKTGNPSLDADVIGDLAEMEIPHAKQWKLWSDLGRLSSMYYAGYAEKTGKDGRLRARIKQLRDITLTADGMADRFSIERVNLQAMPHDRKLAEATEGLGVPSVRQLVAAEVESEYPEWELWELDLSQAELRVGALLSGCRKMLKAFWNEDDVHQLTAELVGVPRPTGKMSNFLLIFDGGWLAFLTQVKKQTGGKVKLTAKEAKNIVFPWKRTYPQFKKMADQWEEFAKRTGYVPLANGQLRWFTAREDKRKAWNQRVQGSIAQFFQEWLLEAEAVCQRAGVPESGGVLMTVHDSIILLLPKSVVPQVVNEIKAAAVSLWDETFEGVPGAVDAKRFGGE